MPQENVGDGLQPWGMAKRLHLEYTPEMPAEAAADPLGIADVPRYLGVKHTGGAHAHINRRLKHYGIDTSHFRRDPHNRGKPSAHRLRPEQILVVLPPGTPRPRRQHLVRALLETGVPYHCAACKIGGVWQGEPLTLHVDHINGDWPDNRRENLRFLCPNRHSQTGNFSGKSKNKKGP